MHCHGKQKWLGQNLWNCLGKDLLPALISLAGGWLDRLALSIIDQDLRALPILKTKQGNVRKLADPVNRFLLLQKLQKEKQHRQRVARSHEELGGSSNRMIRYENYMDTLLHMKALENSKLGANKQLSVCFDPSTYGGKETMVAIAYSAEEHKSAYLLSQQLTHVMLSDLHEDLLPLGRSRKLTKLEGFKEIRGLHASLRTLGLSLTSFKVPTGLMCRALTPDEFRLEGAGGGRWIHNQETNETVPETPEGLTLGDVPVLVTITDQGPNNLAALNFLQYHPQQAILILPLFDPYHRGWNDIKLALKRSICGGWRTVLEYALVGNLNYGPFHSSTWHYKKKAKLQEFILSEGVSSPYWQKYLPKICQEQRIPEPSSFVDSQNLLEKVAALDSFATKGPLIKLMRWFSWFESMSFYSGELWATKMILEFSEDHGAQGSEAEIDERPKDGSKTSSAAKKDHQAELRELKKRKGSWKLAPELITGKSMAIKDSIMAVGKASWKLTAARAREVVTPEHVLELNISCSYQRFWLHELEETIRTSLFEAGNIKHLFTKWRTHEEVLIWHIDLMDKILEARTHSLTAWHCLPPLMYSHVLAGSYEVGLQAHKLAIEHWKIILAAEGAENEGESIEPLSFCHFRHSPLIRTVYMSFEDDQCKKRVMTTQSSARKLVMVMAKSFGDSRIIENVHQHGRDLFRASKANSISNTAIMANVLRSGVLESKKVPVIQGEALEKATGPQWQDRWRGSVVKSLKSRSVKMPLEIQNLMKPKKASEWPSPSPGAVFQSVAASQWLFTYWGEKKGVYAQHSVNSSWFSFLARPGALLAQQSSGLIYKVLASAQFSLLAVVMEVKTDRQGENIILCCRTRTAFQWVHIIDVDDWIELQVEPALLQENKGPLGWKVKSQPLTLISAALIKGHTITYNLAIKLVEHFNGTVKKNTAKQTVMEMLIKLAGVPDEHMAEALSHLKPKKEKEDLDFDTDLSEVISELGQDDGNNQDLKDYKQKKRARKLRRAAAKDQPVEPPEKKKRKPKAKGKAKAKAKPKAKAKGVKKTFLKRNIEKRQLEKDAAQQSDQHAQQGKGDEAHPMDQDRKGDEAHPMDQDRKGDEAHPMEPMEVEPEDVPMEPTEHLETETKEDQEDHPMGVEEHEEEPTKAKEKPEASSSSAAPRAPRRRSPEELMSAIQPPGCKMGISFQDHRFTSIWKADHKELKGEMAQKRFSRTFAKQRGWRDALQLVHHHCWLKWGKLEATYPLEPGQERQTPGTIASDIYEGLQPIIDSLAEPIKYERL